MLKRLTLLFVLGVAALAMGDVITPGTGVASGGWTAVETTNGMQIVQGYAADLKTDGAGGGSVDVRIMPISYQTGQTHFAVCKQPSAPCNSGWVELASWSSASVTFTCADVGMVPVVACTNDASSGAADHCANAFVSVEDNESICGP